MPPAARVRPASARVRYCVAHPGSHHDLTPYRCLLFCLRQRSRAGSDKTYGPTATRGSSHALRFLCSFEVAIDRIERTLESEGPPDGFQPEELPEAYDEYCWLAGWED